ncbi:MAG TPA: hypothetical protein VEH76_11260 [Methylocystis sp.]|nr:hypothetical protein [Methylocystis sp.]
MTTEAQATAPHKERLPNICDRLERDGAKREHLHEIIGAMQSCHCEETVRVARLFFGKGEDEKITLAEFSDALETMTQRLWGIKALLHGFDEDLNGNPLFDGAHQLVVDVANEMERIAEAFASEIATQRLHEAEKDEAVAQAITAHKPARDHIEASEG